MYEQIRHFLVYRDWCTASTICERGLGLPVQQNWALVRGELDLMLARGEVEYDTVKMMWRMPNRGISH